MDERERERESALMESVTHMGPMTIGIIRREKKEKEGDRLLTVE